MWPRARAAGIDERWEVVVGGDGAPWIWNLAAEHFPRRVEILDWYHAQEHVSATARILSTARGQNAARNGAVNSWIASGTTGSMK